MGSHHPLVGSPLSAHSAKATHSAFSPSFSRLPVLPRFAITTLGNNKRTFDKNIFVLFRGPFLLHLLHTNNAKRAFTAVKYQLLTGLQLHRLPESKLSRVHD